MFVQFKTGNFLSFNETVTFSLVGYAPIKEHESNGNSISVFNDPTNKSKLLKSGVLYGANGSGKSNLFAAMSFFRRFILTSSNDSQATDEIDVIRFLLSADKDDEPSFFEMIFFIDEIRYRYGFEVDKEKVHSEWLFSLKNESSARESNLFTREFQEIKSNVRNFKEGKGKEENTRPNALFLSTVAQLNGKTATNILTWFKSDFNFLEGLKERTTIYTVEKFQQDEDFRKFVIEFFTTINIGFENIEILEESEILKKSISHVPPELKSELEEVLAALNKLRDKAQKSEDTKVESKSILINTLHKKFDSSGKFLNYESLDFGLESKGTQKLFSLLGPIYDTIQNGKILVIDELDSRLHSLLTIELIKFFHSVGNKHAQLIFVSHDTTLLRKDIFRRDQIWFAEKDTIGATDLYSLVEYKVNQATVRNDASFEKDYLLGKYGAIPFLGDIQSFVEDFIYEQKEQEK